MDILVPHWKCLKPFSQQREGGIVLNAFGYWIGVRGFDELRPGSESGQGK